MDGEKEQVDTLQYLCSAQHLVTDTPDFATLTSHSFLHKLPTRGKLICLLFYERAFHFSNRALSRAVFLSELFSVVFLVGLVWVSLQHDGLKLLNYCKAVQGSNVMFQGTKWKLLHLFWPHHVVSLPLHSTGYKHVTNTSTQIQRERLDATYLWCQWQNFRLTCVLWVKLH